MSRRTPPCPCPASIWTMRSCSCARCRNTALARSKNSSGWRSKRSCSRPLMRPSANIDRRVEIQREVRPAVVVNLRSERLQKRRGNAPAAALVRKGGVCKAVAEHPATALQGWLDHRGEMLSAGGEDQQRLGERVYALIARRQGARCVFLPPAACRRVRALPVRRCPLRLEIDARKPSWCSCRRLRCPPE